MTDLPSRVVAEPDLMCRTHLGPHIGYVGDQTCDYADAPGHPCEIGLYLVLTKEEAMRYAYDHADRQAAADEINAMTAEDAPALTVWPAGAASVLAAALGVDDD